MDPQALPESKGARVAFWVTAGLGAVASPIAWAWYGLAQEEAQSEQGKAVAAGTSMAGSAEVVGGLPRVLAHLIGLGVLLIFGWGGYRRRGMVLAIAVVGVASLIGVLFAQLLWAAVDSARRPQSAPADTSFVSLSFTGLLPCLRRSGIGERLGSQGNQRDSSAVQALSGGMISTESDLRTIFVSDEVTCWSAESAGQN